MRASPLISMVDPLYNEEDNGLPLVQAVRGAMAGIPGWELILIDDGSHDGTWEVAEGIAACDDHVRVGRLARNYGQTQAMQAGFDLADGDVIVSMDGDMQNDPADIPRLVAKLE
jgi:glycosyltransferase involved in cell wall biosynthesis